MTENERWLLSYYRTSEISGALFFGRMARSMKEGSIQKDMTKHFADESNHAWLWTRCISELGAHAIRLDTSYQDQYLGAVGLPVNIMEILAITQVFEKRVIGQYAIHRNLPSLNPIIKGTLETIMEDEVWHIEWISKALKELEPEFGAEQISKTLNRMREADAAIYRKLRQENNERLQFLFESTPKVN